MQIYKMVRAPDLDCVKLKNSVEVLLPSGNDGVDDSLSSDMF